MVSAYQIRRAGPFWSRRCCVWLLLTRHLPRVRVVRSWWPARVRACVLQSTRRATFEFLARMADTSCIKAMQQKTTAAQLSIVKDTPVLAAFYIKTASKACRLCDIGMQTIIRTTGRWLEERHLCANPRSQQRGCNCTYRQRRLHGSLLMQLET